MDALPIGLSLSPSERKLIWLNAFADAGFPLIPLRGKIPSIPNWSKTRPGEFPPAQFAPDGVNYGVVLPPSVVVVDVDPRNFRPGDDPVKRLRDAVGPGGLPESFTVKTGGGGLHVYYSKPAEIAVRNGLDEYPGVEFKSSGRQIVGPGSTHPETNQLYEVIAGDPRSIAAAPARLLDLVSRPAVSWAGEAKAGLAEYHNDAETQGRYLAFLQDVAEPSVEGKAGDHNAFKVACAGRDLGLPPGTTWDLMLEVWNPRCEPPWDAEELKAKVANAYRYAQNAVGSGHPAAVFDAVPQESASPAKKAEEFAWVTNRHGAVSKCFQNLVTFLRFPPAGLANVFGFNEFSGRVEFMNPAPWHRGRLPASLAVGDRDLKLLKGHLAGRHGFEASVSEIDEAVVNVSEANKFHPVREYLEGLKWDGVPRLDFWLRDFLGAEDTPYVRAVARKVLCAMVMRVFRPGCKFDHVLVLEGAQGIGKSTVCRILGGPWAADFSIDPHNKDTIQMLQGKWVVELAEMEVARRADRDALKAFISRTKDEARLAFGRVVGEFARQFVLIASKNPSTEGGYLEDDGGQHRRWWPVACAPRTLDGQVDFAAFKAARNQLFAEAVVRVKREPNGEPLYMETHDLQAAAHDAAMARQTEHAWTDRIADWLRQQEQGAETALDFLTSRRVYIEAMGGLERQFDRRAQLAIAVALRQLGWKTGTKRIDGRMLKGYLPLLRPSTTPKAGAEGGEDLFFDPLDIL